MKNKNLATIAAVSLLVGFQSLAAFAGGSDVVVKKNADGTVDAYDAPSAAQTQQAEPAQPSVTYHLKNNPGTRRISGVSVRTNPDGSIDTFDEGSAPTPIHSSGSAHHAAARSHSTTKSTASKTKSTTVKAHH
jgi:hypothetical protein